MMAGVGNSPSFQTHPKTYIFVGITARTYSARLFDASHVRGHKAYIHMFPYTGHLSSFMAQILAYLPPP